MVAKEVREEEVGWTRNLGFGIGMCTILDMEWIVNGDLLYSTRRPTKYSVIIYMGKESEKEEKEKNAGWEVI